MSFEDWEPLYEEILEDFGFSRDGDEASAELISRLLDGKPDYLPLLRELLAGKEVLVCGKAPCLQEDLQSLSPSLSENRDIGDGVGRVLVAADGACSTCLVLGVVPDVVVTDLDGDHDDLLRCSREGSLMVVHAHGDNMDKVEELIPRLDKVIATTQSVPLPNVHNFGGFSDGDRAVFLSVWFHAKTVKLLGFDYHDPSVNDIKKKKLKWTERLIDRLRKNTSVVIE